MDFLIGATPWLKALHVIAVIAWMAGMLYLPRLFVYHAATEVGSESSETFKVMERKLLRIIVNPAMLATWVFGLLLAGTPGLINWAMGFMWVKLGAVIVLSGVHGYFARCVRQFREDKRVHPQRFYRMINEVPTVLMILIVIMIIVKPF
jgi:putative membrane protein